MIVLQSTSRGNANHLRELGLAALDSGEAGTGVALLAEALEHDPSSTALRLDLARALVFAGRPAEALEHYNLVLSRHPARAEAQVERADLLLDLGRTNGAIEGYRRTLALHPEHRHAARLLAGLTGTGAAEAAAYVAGLYDAYAAEFDDHLTRQLGYDVPAEIRRAVEGLLPRPVPTLDLGCGTGLVAEALRRIASPIDGIDLSPAMVERARQRGLYRSLAVGDLVRLAGRDPFAGPYGLVTAADVFIHVADLAPVFAAVMGALTADGLFAFSTEETREPVALRSSGRFAHGRDHVREVASRHGMAVVSETPVTVRLEQLRPVPGRLFVLRTI